MHIHCIALERHQLLRNYLQINAVYSGTVSLEVIAVEKHSEYRHWADRDPMRNFQKAEQIRWF